MHVELCDEYENELLVYLERKNNNIVELFSLSVLFGDP
jgi:hypothetical protein